MSERKVVERTATPLTVASLTEHLRACGLAEGQTVLVHLSMSQLGWVVGGAQAVILALLAAVGDSGTIMMPTHSSGNTEPCRWQHPPVPEAWWETIRDHTPAYDPLATPTRNMGSCQSYSIPGRGPSAARTWPSQWRRWGRVPRFW